MNWVDPFGDNALAWFGGLAKGVAAEGVAAAAGPVGVVIYAFYEGWQVGEALGELLKAKEGLAAAKALEEAMKRKAAEEAAKRPKTRPRPEEKPEPKPKEKPEPKEKEKEKKEIRLALGVGDEWEGGPRIIPLLQFARLHRALPFMYWPTEHIGEFYSGWVTWSVFSAGFSIVINRAITAGAWVYFNLAGISQCETPRTYWELTQFMLPGNAHWLARTKFFDNERELTPAEALAHIMEILGQ